MKISGNDTPFDVVYDPYIMNKENRYLCIEVDFAPGSLDDISY